MKTAIYTFLILSIVVLGASFAGRNAQAAMEKKEEAAAPQSQPASSAVKKHIIIGTGGLTGVYHPAPGG